MICIPPNPNWGELLDQAEMAQDFDRVVELMWVPLQRKGMAENVGNLLESDNPDVADLASTWLYLPDPTPYEWVEREIDHP